MADIDDFLVIAGLVGVGFMAYKEWYDGMSPEQIMADIDTKLRGFLDDVVSKLPPLPNMPQFLPPTAPPATPLTPPTPTITQPTNESGKPVSKEDAGQLPDTVSKQETEKVLQKPAAATTAATITPPNVAGPVVAFVGDWDNNDKAKQTVAAMQKHGVSYVFGVGDNGYDSSASTWFNSIMLPYKGRIKSAVGNHDAGESSIYLGLFGQTTWNFTYKFNENLSVVFIDTEKGITDALLESLTKSAKAQSKHVAYVFHKPYITSSNGHHKPSENKWSSIIDTVAKRNGVRLIFSGHNHLYEHFFCNGTHYITTGAGGRKFYPGDCQSCGKTKCVTDTNGFVKVTVGSDLLCQFVSNAGQVLDSFVVSATGNEAQAVQQFLRAYINPIYITPRNRR
jgi:predicted phosphodiesterase